MAHLRKLNKTQDVNLERTIEELFRVIDFGGTAILEESNGTSILKVDSEDTNFYQPEIMGFRSDLDEVGYWLTNVHHNGGFYVFTIKAFEYIEGENCIIRRVEV